jgi:hypothetical protein
MNLGGGEMPRPMAAPSGISAPVATVQETGAMALARSLSAIQPELNGFLEESKDIYREREANRAYDTIQGMTYDEAKEAVANGTMRGTESPWFRAAFQKQFGMAHAANRRRQIITAYNTEFDKQNGNIDEFLARFAQEDYEAFGGSEFIASGIREGMDGVFNTVRNQHAEFQDSQLQTRAAEQFYTIANDAVATAVESGGDVNAAITAVTSQHIAAGLIDQDKADAALLGLAEQYASTGDTASLEAVLNADPYGRGSFLSRGGFAVKAQTLLEQGKATAGDKFRVANVEPRAALEGRAAAGLLDDGDKEQMRVFMETKQMSPDQYESLVMQNEAAQQRRLMDATEANVKTTLLGSATDLILAGQGAAVQDTTVTLPDGSTKTVTGKELRETVINEQVTALLSREDASVAVAAQHMSSWAIGETYKPWEDSLSTGYLALTGALTKPDKDGKVTIPPAAQNAYGLWRELSGAESLRNQHVKDSTAAAIYRDAEVLEEIGGMTPEEALTASASIDRKSSRTSLASAVDRDKFSDAVDGYMSGGLFGSDPINGQIVKTAIEEQARIYMDLNLPQDKAIEKAISAFETSFTKVNGVYVNTRDRFVPADIEGVSNAYVEDFLKANPTYDEAFFVPDRSQDYWTLTDEWGAPLRNAPRIHVSELSTYLSQRTMAATNEAIKENQ